jgi:hypothetical protein
MSARQRRRLTFTRALTCAVIGAACGDDSNPPARGVSADQEIAERCELPRGGYAESCNECLAARCCEPIEICKQQSDCSSQLDCVLLCQYASDPPACSRACFAAGRHPDYVRYDDCSFEDCRSECWL